MKDRKRREPISTDMCWAMDQSGNVGWQDCCVFLGPSKLEELLWRNLLKDLEVNDGQLETEGSFSFFLSFFLQDAAIRIWVLTWRAISRGSIATIERFRRDLGKIGCGSLSSFLIVGNLEGEPSPLIADSSCGRLPGWTTLIVVIINSMRVALRSWSFWKSCASDSTHWMKTETTLQTTKGWGLEEGRQEKETERSTCFSAE